MGIFSLTRSFSLNQQYNMKAFIVLFALVAAAYAEAEAEADPYLLYGGYNGYAGWGGWTGYAHHPYALSSVVKSVEVAPAKVEVKALAAPAVVAAAAPAALTYHHAAPVAYAGYAGYPYAHHLIGKREAEADADPAYFYNGYSGYAGWGYGGYGYAGLAGYYGGYAGYPYAHAAYPYAHAAYAHAPSDPTNPHLVHTSRVGICTNYLGAQVPC